MRTRIEDLLKSADLSITSAGVTLSTSTGIQSLALTPAPPAGFTGPVAPYYVRTEFEQGWWVYQRGGVFGSNPNRVTSTYNGGDNMVFPNGSGASYSEYCAGGQVWHLKPLWCTRIDCYYASRANSHNIKLTVRRSATPTVVVQEIMVVLNNPSMFRVAGGADRWTPNATFHLPGYDTYILEYEMIQVTSTTDGTQTSFSFHGDYIIN